jgi:hypothetical protein
VITLSETRFITRISSEPVPYFHVPHRLTIKDAYHQLPYYQRNNPSLRESNHPNDQLHPQEEELGQYLADIFSHLNINEQEESIQQTTKQASHQKNKDKKSRTQGKKAQIRRKRTNEQ